MMDKTQTQKMDNTDVHCQNVEKVERFQSLQTGQYWRALRDIHEEGIDAGTVLLILSIRWVDDAPHTIILRPHPDKIDQRVELQIPQEDGTTKRKFFIYDEHRFLLDDFLHRFEYEPDHQVIRNAEIRAVQGQINNIQTELLEAQSNPAILEKVVETELQDQRSQGDQPGAQNLALPVRTQGIHALTGSTVGDAIGTGITAESIASMKAAANQEHNIATIKAKWIQSKTTDIANAIRAMTPYYEEQAAAALAQTEDVRTYVAKLLQGIESLDLYVGKDVEVFSIRSGEPAPKEVPLTFVQKKLLMDEELAVWADIDKWFDFDQEDLFFEALRTHDQLVEQIFPTERCVLVMATTRRYIDYGDKLTNYTRNQENKVVFLLVRNGMNIHRVFSPVESHLGTARLFPSQNDQNKVFAGLDGNQIKFEDVTYTDKLNEHDKFALHYKRFLLLACGLDHRLKLFGEFYDAHPSMRFVSMDFQEQYCRFLHDDDGAGLLPGEQRQPVSKWIEEKNAYLRSGSRVLCNWYALMTPDTAPAACKADPELRRNRGYEIRYRPYTDMSVAIAYRDGSSNCVDVEVKGHSYNTNENRIFNCKVNLGKSKDGKWDQNDLPFLCLDAITPEELHWYIHHRGSRRDHLTYIRLFKHALKHIEQERKSEHDMRARMAQALVDGKITCQDGAESIIDQAVIAWRAANRGKPLPEFKENQAPAAWKSLLDQLYILAGEGQRRVSEIEEYMRSQGLEPLRLVLSGDAKLVIYAAPRPEECDNRFEPHAWVHSITLNKGRAGYAEKARRWVILSSHTSGETTLHQWPQADNWNNRTSYFPSFERKRKIMDEANTWQDRLKPYTSPMSHDEFNRQFGQWKALREKILFSSKKVHNPMLAIPFGLIYYPLSNEMSYLCMGAFNPEDLLYKMAPDEATRQDVRNEFIKVYRNKNFGRTEFDTKIAGKSDWMLVERPVSVSSDARFGLFIHHSIGIPMHTLDGRRRWHPMLSDWFARWQQKVSKYGRVWIADGVSGEDGSIALDKQIGNALPSNFEPVQLHEIEIRETDGPYTTWIDICPADISPEAEDSTNTFWPNNRNDAEIKKLIESVNTAGIKSYQINTQILVSPRAAREYIISHTPAHHGMEYHAVAANMIADAPQPPAGVERWYIIRKQVSAGQ